MCEDRRREGFADSRRSKGTLGLGERARDLGVWPLVALDDSQFYAVCETRSRACELSWAHVKDFNPAAKRANGAGKPNRAETARKLQCKVTTTAYANLPPSSYGAPQMTFVFRRWLRSRRAASTPATARVENFALEKMSGVWCKYVQSRIDGTTCNAKNIQVVFFLQCCMGALELSTAVVITARRAHNSL